MRNLGKYALNRHVSSLRGLVNDQFFSMIHFCLSMPFGGEKLAEQMLRDLAILHSKNSLESEPFKIGYAPLPKSLTPVGALKLVYKNIHVKEKVADDSWVRIDEREGDVEVQYSRDDCVYHAHCDALRCDGLKCMCVRRFFCEGIIKVTTGEDYESVLHTPDLEDPMCRFSLHKTERGRDEIEHIRDKIRLSVEENIKLEEAVKVRTRQLERQKNTLKESKIRIKAITSSANDAIVMMDSDGAVTFWNQAAERMFGISSDEIIGGKIDEFIIPPRYVEEHKKGVTRSKRSGGGPVTGKTVEYTAKRSNGEEFPVELSLSTVLVEGKWHAIGVVRDITERKQEELSHKRLYDKHRKIVENSPSGIMTLDNDLRIVYENPEMKKIIGVPEGRDSPAIGMKITDLPSVKIANIGHVFEALRNNKKISTEFPFTSIFGKESFLSITGVPIFEKGSFAGAILLINDTLERKRMEEQEKNLEKQIRHAQKLESLGVLAGGIAHDFNNLLTSILGNADLALMDLPPTSPIRGYIKDIGTSSRRAADLTRQMLAYSGKGKFVIRNIDLNEIIEEMVHLLEVAISKKVVLKYDLSKILPPIEADVAQINQVIMNLVINASEAIGEKSGVISLTTGAMECDKTYLKEAWHVDCLPEGLYVYLEIADTGSGMDKDTMDKVFDPFFTTKFTGRGLGMAAVQGIARGHNGAVKIYSEVGKGTTFKVLFPASKKRADSMEKNLDATDAKALGGTVLLVDDEETVRSIGKRMLEKMGFTVVTVCNGVEALEEYRKRPDEFVFVLLDLTMPQMDGEDCFRKLRQISKDGCIVMTSGYNEQDVAQRFIGKGLSGFIAKPFEMANMKRVIIQALKNHGK